MQNERIRILQYTYGGRAVGGIEMFLYRIYQNINRELIQFDFYLQNGNSMQQLEKDIIALGGKIVYGKPFNNYISKFLYHTRQLSNTLRSGNYDIIHINMESPLWILHAALLAKVYRVKRIVIHSHSNQRLHQDKHRFMSLLFGKAIQKIGDQYFSASEQAGKFLFPDKNDFIVIKNGIDIKDFLFNCGVREEYRRRLRLENQYVLGHIGRFEKNKNQKFLVSIFIELRKYIKNAKLIFVGGYEEAAYFSELKEMITANDLQSEIMILGIRNDVNNLLQAFDLLVLPSYNEGFGITALEAQAAGLHVLASDSIPRETQVTNLIEYLSVENSVDLWVRKIIQYKNYERKKMSDVGTLKEYDIKRTAKEVQCLYNQICDLERGSLCM